jgi:dipeptidyl aminopeptidase/acylaminoacyl peptidase
MKKHLTLITLTISLGMISTTTRASEQKTKHRGLIPQTNESNDAKNPLSAPSNALKHPAETTPASPSEAPFNGSPTPNKTNLRGASECGTAHSIDTLIQIPSHHSPQATSQGVFFLSDMRESPQIFLLSTPKSWPQQITFFPDGVSYFRPNQRGDSVLIASEEDGDEQYDLYLWEKGAIRPLIVDRNKRIESVFWEPEEKGFLFTSNERNKLDMDLYRWDLKKNSAELLMELEGSQTITDISADGKKVLLTRSKSVTDSDVFLFDIEARKLTNLTEHTSQVASKEGKFTLDSQGVFLISDKENGTAQVYFLKLTSPNQTKLFSQSVDEAEDIVISPSRDSLLIIRNHEGYSILEAAAVDKLGQKKNIIPVPKIGKAILRGASFESKKLNPTLFFSTTSSTQPAHIFNWKSNTLKQWTEFSEQILKPACLTQEELVHYPASDGRSIPAFLYLPAASSNSSSSRKPIPFIVYIHGGPESQFRPVFSKIFQYFLERGYGVFAPNVRGSTGYGRLYTLLDNYKLRMDSVRDAIEGSQWLIKERYTSKNQLGLYGVSYGGFMVLSMIEKAPDLFTAASESVGISNFVTFLKNTKPYRRALREIEYGPLSDEDFLNSISPLFHADKIRTPLLIFQGAKDPRVPVSETEQMVAALKKNNIPVEFKIFADEGHGNLKLKNILEQARWMVHFFEKVFAQQKKEGASSFAEETP